MTPLTSIQSKALESWNGCDRCLLGVHGKGGEKSGHVVRVSCWIFALDPSGTYNYSDRRLHLNSRVWGRKTKARIKLGSFQLGPESSYVY